MRRKRRDECLFCTSRSCDFRIYSELYDEVACRSHHKELEKHADQNIEGNSTHILGTSRKVRELKPKQREENKSSYIFCIRRLKTRLEKLFPDCTITVSSRKYSFGRSIDVTAHAKPHKIPPYCDLFYETVKSELMQFPAEHQPYVIGGRHDDFKYLNFDTIVRDNLGHLSRQVTPGADRAYKTRALRKEYETF